MSARIVDFLKMIQIENQQRGRTSGPSNFIVSSGQFLDESMAVDQSSQWVVIGQPAHFGFRTHPFGDVQTDRQERATVGIFLA